MDKKILKILSFILAIVVTFTSLPMTAFASAIPEGTDEEVNVIEREKAIIEMVDMRTATAKYFRLEDGSYYVAQYDSNVHYKDDNGEWQDIDNTLSVSGSEISTSNAKIKFAKKTTGSEELFALHDGNRKLTLFLNNANKKIKGKITNNESELGENATKLQKMTTLDKISASVIYEDILEDTDLEYVIDGLNIKENIIVKAKADDYAYSFTMKLNNLVAVLNDRGDVIVSDSSTNEVIYTIPAPVMWDSNNVVSDGASYTLVDLGNGKYTLTVIADSEWMNADERVYPVTIDPPITSHAFINGIIDLSISSSDINPPSSATLTIDNNYWTYWKMTNLPTLPASAYITDATFTLHYDTYESIGSPVGFIGIYEVLNNWDSNLTWSSKGQPATHYTDFFESNQSTINHCIFTGYQWNITPIVKKWYAGQNYGLMLKPIDNTIFTGSATFLSDNNTRTSETPLVTIQYVDMKGLEDYWTYTSQDAGFAGNAAVNNATGKTVVTIPTLTTTDALMPITPTLVYDSTLVQNDVLQDYIYPNAQIAVTSQMAGNGIKLNLSETLIERAYANEDGYAENMYVWSDGDGTEHYFMETSVANKYMDEDGLKLTLEVSGNTCTITDSDDTKRVFSSRSYLGNGIPAWYLSSIEDKSGNKVTFTVDSKYRPIAINLVPVGMSSIEQMRIMYNDAGSICAVWNPSSREGVVFRYSSTVSGDISTSSGDYLRQVIRAHGPVTEEVWRAFYNTNSSTSINPVFVDGVASYSYDASGRMIEIVNQLSNYKIAYTYDLNGRVISVTEKVGNVVGQSISLSYGETSTEIRTSGTNDILNDNDDLFTIYGFDSYGRSVSCYTTDITRTKLYGASNGQYVGEENENAKNNLKSSVQTSQTSPNYLVNGGFENGTSQWVTSGGWTLDSLLPYAGRQHIKLTVGNTNSSSVIYQDAYLDAGDYNLSMHIDTIDTIGATVHLRVIFNPGSEAPQVISKRISINEYYATGAYVFESLDFTVAPQANNAKLHTRIEITVSGPSSNYGDIYIDNVMLSKTRGACEFDVVQMGHFETSAGGTHPINHWETYEDVNVSIVDSGDAKFGKVLKIDPILGINDSVMQKVYEATPEEKDAYLNDPNPQIELMAFTLSAWGKSEKQAYAGTSVFGIKAVVDYYDKEGNTPQEVFDVKFDKGIKDWQFASIGFATNPEYGMVNRITVYAMYIDNPTPGYFDSITLIQNCTNADIYNYTPEGYVSSYQSGSNRSWYEYDETDRDKVVAVIYSDKTIVDYDYDAKDRVVSETVSKYNGVYRPWSGGITGEITYINRTNYLYNAQGQVYRSFTTDLSSTGYATIQNTTYNNTEGSHIFGTVAEEEDSLGYKTKYFYNANNGRLLATIYPNGDGVSYAYDAVGNLIQVLPANISTSSTGYTSDTSSAQVDYTYDAAMRLSAIKTNPSSASSTTYTFAYDVFGNTAGISVGSRQLASYEYNANNGKLSVLTYGNGHQVKYLYDVLDRVSEIQYNTGSGNSFETVYEYTYDARGNLFSVTDHISDEVTMYKYDALGKLISSFVYDHTTYNNLYGTRVIYDEQSRISYVYHGYDYKYSSGIKNDRTVYSYAYNANNGNLLTMSIGESMLGEYFRGSITPTYDNLGRTSQKIIDIDANENDAFYNKLTYNYVKSESELYDSGRVSQVTSEVRKGSTTSVISSNTYNYTYDANGNITQITNASDVVQYNYYYDDLGQLIREDNRALGYSYVYTYDNAGNITSKVRYAFTTGTLGSVQSTISYTYGDSSWKDLLMNYAGTSITYDEIGNPETIGDKTLTWKGRELISYTDEGFSVSYGYNADGIRTYKEINSGGSIERHEYVVSGSQIVKETVFLNGVEQYILVYVYDELGAPIGIKYRTPSYAENVYSCYFFEKNLQGDIVAIYNASGTKIGTYTYDAWGNGGATMLNASGVDRLILLSYNPFRYRGYYYDTDSGWYYLQSRYYNPSWGRFISSDDTQYLGANGDLEGFNLFAYCGNNPVMGYDPYGTFDWSSFGKGAGWLAIGITAICVGVSVLTCGVAAPAMVAVAAVTVGAGALTAVNGAAEIGEAFTGYNVVRDTVFSGNQKAYDAYANITAAVAEVGTAVCGGWMAKNSPRINAYKSMDSYNVKNKHLSSGSGDWSKFNTTSQAELRALGREALKNTPMSSLVPNSADSYAAIYNFGRVIGTSGQTSARLVFSTAGKIITFFPQ